MEEIWICGGIANKNSMMMQIYSDVLNMPLHISRCTQAPALGSAIHAATAAGEGNIFEMVERMGDRRCNVVEPDTRHQPIYDQLFKEYKQLHDYFGKGENSVMERLRRIAK